ncbi:MAG: hypothetical protein ACR2RF_24315 [Geminicoccaceae bacterium]
MGSPAVQVLLESVLAPFTFAALVLIYIRWISQDRLVAFAQALAVVLAFGMTYVFAFGWPADFVFSAKSKIVLTACIGLAIGMVVEQRPRWARFGLVAGAIGLPIWIGIPVIEQGRPESALLALPITAALLAPSLIANTSADIEAPTGAALSKILIALTLAFGLAAIALFARTFSFAELCLSLGSALLAIMAFSHQRLAVPAGVTTAALLSALITAMLLYSEACPLAIFVLSIVIGAKRLTDFTGGKMGAETTGRTLIFCLLPFVAAIVIARIDAGPFSLY